MSWKDINDCKPETSGIDYDRFPQLTKPTKPEVWSVDVVVWGVLDCGDTEIIKDAKWNYKTNSWNGVNGLSGNYDNSIEGIYWMTEDEYHLLNQRGCLREPNAENTYMIPIAVIDKVIGFYTYCEHVCYGDYYVGIVEKEPMRMIEVTEVVAKELNLI